MIQYHKINPIFLIQKENPENSQKSSTQLIFFMEIDISLHSFKLTSLKLKKNKA